MPLVRGPGPLDCIRHVRSNPGTLGGMSLSPKEMAMRGVEPSPPSGGIKELKVSEVREEWMGYALLEKKVMLTQCDGLQWHSWALNQLVELKLRQIGVCVPITIWAILGFLVAVLDMGKWNYLKSSFDWCQLRALSADAANSVVTSLAGEVPGAKQEP